MKDTCYIPLRMIFVEISLGIQTHEIPMQIACGIKFVLPRDAGFSLCTFVGQDKCQEAFNYIFLQVVELTLYPMDMECGYDYLSIYDGYDQYSRQLAQLCNTTSTRYYTTSGRYAFLKMSTDGSVTSTGFRIYWYGGKL